MLSLTCTWPRESPPTQLQVGWLLAATESTRLKQYGMRSLEVGGSRVNSQLWDISRSHPLRVYAVGLAHLAGQMLRVPPPRQLHPETRSCGE